VTGNRPDNFSNNTAVVSQHEVKHDLHTSNKVGSIGSSAWTTFLNKCTTPMNSESACYIISYGIMWDWLTCVRDIYGSYPL